MEHANNPSSAQLSRAAGRRYPSDDINKFLWMVRIGGGVFPEIKERDYLGAGNYRVDSQAGKVSGLRCWQPPHDKELPRFDVGHGCSPGLQSC